MTKIKIDEKFSNVERELFAFISNFGNDNDDANVSILSNDEELLKQYNNDKDKFIKELCEKGNRLILDEDKY